LISPAYPETAPAHHTGDDFFRLHPDDVIFRKQCFSAQLISSLSSLLIFDNVGRLVRDLVIVDFEIATV
jgi:hypothetical protein